MTWASRDVVSTRRSSVSTRVRAAFSGEGLLQDTAITVHTTDHVVTLSGIVATTAARVRAGEIALTTEGVTRVVNEIGIGGQ